jgi:hypothetical protein
MVTIKKVKLILKVAQKLHNYQVFCVTLIKLKTCFTKNDQSF